MKLKRNFILASQSPQRIRIIQKLKIPVQIIPSQVSENCREKDPRKLVLKLAVRKARAVAKANPEAWVLGADTVVFCRGEILTKPKDPSDAQRILALLNGRRHKVYTGVALVGNHSGATWLSAAVSIVEARKLTPESLSRLAGKHMDKAGAYAVQDQKDPFIRRVIGARDNVIGLPLKNVRNLLKKAVVSENR